MNFKIKIIKRVNEVTIRNNTNINTTNRQHVDIRALIYLYICAKHVFCAVVDWWKTPLFPFGFAKNMVDNLYLLFLHLRRKWYIIKAYQNTQFARSKVDKNSYYQQKSRENLRKLKEVQSELPAFCEEFFRGIGETTNSLTRLNYAYDLRTFFEYLGSESSRLPRSFTLEDCNGLEAIVIEKYLAYLTLYQDPVLNGEADRENGEKGKARKLACLRTFFKYFFKKGYLTRNVASLVDMPKIHEKAIIRLDVQEVVRILNVAETGQNLSPHQQKLRKNQKIRDVAILSLFLGTGIRISELVGLNLRDFDFESNSFLVTRKGGSQMTLYFSDEIRKPLQTYLQLREATPTLSPDDNAFFLSQQRKRISPRAIQDLVKKYASIAAPLKHITPHKLRSTFGTELYRETGDIYLVADVLGHKDVNTTRKHYAAMSEDRRRLAAKAIKLRED